MQCISKWNVCSNRTETLSPRRCGKIHHCQTGAGIPPAFRVWPKCLLPCQPGVGSKSSNLISDDPCHSHHFSLYIKCLSHVHVLHQGQFNMFKLRTRHGMYYVLKASRVTWSHANADCLLRAFFTKSGRTRVTSSETFQCRLEVSIESAKSLASSSCKFSHI